jgi:hypothetical protein
MAIARDAKTLKRLHHSTIALLIGVNTQLLPNYLPNYVPLHREKGAFLKMCCNLCKIELQTIKFTEINLFLC